MLRLTLSQLRVLFISASFLCDLSVPLRLPETAHSSAGAHPPDTHTHTPECLKSNSSIPWKAAGLNRRGWKRHFPSVFTDQIRHIWPVLDISCYVQAHKEPWNTRFLSFPFTLFLFSTSCLNFASSESGDCKPPLQCSFLASAVN